MRNNKKRHGFRVPNNFGSGQMKQSKMAVWIERLCVNEESIQESNKNLSQVGHCLYVDHFSGYPETHELKNVAVKFMIILTWMFPNNLYLIKRRDYFSIVESERCGTIHHIKLEINETKEWNVESGSSRPSTSKSAIFCCLPTVHPGILSKKREWCCL